ncbi:MAG: sugar ABC transporter ATP-binding protein, partial [Oscillospiraceae bacterium]|nr:sugar ABC transporter ATP-binding protein [Oscillospiraceae bacterium]
MSNVPLLKCEGICKQFSGVPVLKNVNLEIAKGEVHALMGENGAGKSTIIKIITGVYSKDLGDIYMDGELVTINTRKDAINCGISVIYQELSLIPALSVTDNIFLGQEKTKAFFTRHRNQKKAVQELIDKYGFNVNPDSIVETLGMAQRQMVEILKALSYDAKLIIMDEPTSSLSAAESEILFDTIERLRKNGTSVLYISHRLDEVYRISDRLTVMRNGENVGVIEKKDISPKTVIPMMIGREITEKKDYTPPKIFEENVLEVKDLRFKHMVKGVSFKAYGGEILGIGGLIGSGRTEIVRCIFGAEKPTSGTITFKGKPIGTNVKQNVQANFGLVPEDRRNQGFIPLLSTEKNIAIANYDRLGKGPFIGGKEEAVLAEDVIKEYDIRPTNRNMQVINMSGGNQ